MLKVKAGSNNDVEFTAGSRRFKYVKRLSMLSTHCVSMDLTLPGVGVDKGARGVGGGVWSHSPHMCAHTCFSSFISFLPVPFLSPPPPSLSCPLSFSSASYFSFWAISLYLFQFCLPPSSKHLLSLPMVPFSSLPPAPTCIAYTHSLLSKCTSFMFRFV